jgi:hypothetical protein
MKKKIYIFLFFFLPCVAVFAQNEEVRQERKIPERMKEYIQNRLGMSKIEAERFSTVFLRYFHEFAQAHRENKTDRLIFQQKVIELRIKYRGEFKQILDEQRANKVYHYEDEFRKKAIDIIRENRRDRTPVRSPKAPIQ